MKEKGNINMGRRGKREMAGDRWGWRQTACASGVRACFFKKKNNQLSF